MLQIPFVVYSHTDSLDCLRIATDYLKDIKNKILIINHTTNNLEEITQNYQQVLFYNDDLQYGGKLYTTLSQIKSDYIFFIHEIDILLNKDIDTLNQLVQFAKINDIDRINLQPSKNNGPLYTKVSKSSSPQDWETTTTPDTENLYISEQKGINTWRYNVNPAITKLSTIVEMAKQFQNSCYRTIEGHDTQLFYEPLKVYNLHKHESLWCGYYLCVSEYKFFHLTHQRSFIKWDPSNPVTQFNQSYKDCLKEYQNIISKYQLLKGTRPFK